MRIIETEIAIAASTAAIWKVLTAFDQYEQWNPFIVRGRGSAGVGERLQLTMRQQGKKAMVFKPVVTIAQPNRHLQWLGRLLVPGIFDGRHEFVLEAAGSTTQVFHRETFSGVLPALMGRQLVSLERDFNAFNSALRRRAESAVSI